MILTVKILGLHVPRKNRGVSGASGPALPGWLLMALMAGSAPLVSAMSSSPPVCEGEPLVITEKCEDPYFPSPVIDTNEERSDPVPHRYVNGHFQGTDTRFSFYFPLDGYQQRFFHFTHPLIESEDARDGRIGFAIDNGAYLVQTNQGGDEAIRTAEGGLVEDLDPTIVGYRANAAAAKFSREVAADIFGEHRPHGYLSGGSGGSLQVFASMEHTAVWDGAVPYIQGSPQAIPSVYTARIHALRILRDGEVNRFPEILDAIDPGGSGDPYATLNREQREALEEVTRMGFPMRGWFDYPTMDVGALRLVAAYVPLLDPEYFDDYWEVEGYLGHDDPYGSVAEAIVEGDTSVSFVKPVPEEASGELGGLVLPSLWIVGLAEPPQGNLAGAQLDVTSGAAEGEQLPILHVPSPGMVVVVGDADNLAEGDAVTVDNRDYLALQTYHRHQVPDTERYARQATPREHFPQLPEIFPPMPAWDQFRDERGEPIYPQRDVLVGPASARFGSGALQSGRFQGKMIGVQTMMDIDAFPWKGDWIRAQIHEAGNGDRYRLYFVDHADHGIDVTATNPMVGGSREARLVSYGGALEQAILELAAWVEDGVEPPAETQYTMEGAQVRLAERGAQRQGIQPVVHLRANGGERADIEVGETVTLAARVEVPEGAGAIVQVEWDFPGKGEFEPGEFGDVRAGDIEVETEHRYTEPGTYFPVLRVTSHREGDADAAHARVQNIGRARVVVAD